MAVWTNSKVACLPVVCVIPTSRRMYLSQCAEWYIAIAEFIIVSDELMGMLLPTACVPSCVWHCVEYCLNRLPRQLERWSVMLGDKPFMTGNDVTVADLKVYDTFRKLKIYCADPQIASNPFQAHPTLQAFISRVEELPQMKTYMESDAYIARPLNNPHANFK
eukprot:m.209617 g.209617  ORF g.209617 m.209617 type:complete len:163 (+) comp18990_c0_seq3:276-764(+)